jgi:hypothetical protein
MCECVHEGMTFDEIDRYINYAMQSNFSRSTLEKDMLVLKKDLKAPIKVTGRPCVYTFSEPWSFVDQIVKWCDGSGNYQLSDSDRQLDKEISAERELRDESMRKMNNQLFYLKKEQQELQLITNSMSCMSKDWDDKVSRLTRVNSDISIIQKKLNNIRKALPILSNA